MDSSCLYYLSSQLLPCPCSSSLCPLFLPFCSVSHTLQLEFSFCAAILQACTECLLCVRHCDKCFGGIQDESVRLHSVWEWKKAHADNERRKNAKIFVLQSLSHVRLFAIPWTAACQASLSPSPSPRACSNPCPLYQWCHPTIWSSVVPFSSCLQSFPASGSFLMSRCLFASGGQSVGALVSVSVLLMNIQDWFPLGLTCLILQSKGLSRVFSNTAVQSISSLAFSLLYGPTLTVIHDYWKNRGFDYMDLCRQSNISAF